MKAVISVCGRFHAPYGAAVLQREGVLESYVTSMPRDVGLPHNSIRAIPLVESVHSWGGRIPLLSKEIDFNLVKKALYDRMALRHIGPCDIFHAYSALMPLSIARARSLGARIVVDRGIAHPLLMERLISEEYRKYGIRKAVFPQGSLPAQLREFKSADAIFVPSDFVVESFQFQGFPSHKLHSIPYGVDADQFVPAPERRDDVFRILFVGGLRLRKGVQYLLEAYRRLGLKNSELLLVGPVTDEVSAILPRYKGLFRHVGGTAHEQIHRLFQESSLFVFPSLLEGSALVTYEAMACGLPLVTTYPAGSVMRDGREGFLVPVRDVPSLMERIRYCYDNPGQTEAMGRAARKRALHYPWNRYGKSLIQAYKRMLDQK